MHLLVQFALEGSLRIINEALEGRPEKGCTEANSTEVFLLFGQACLAIELVHVHDLPIDIQIGYKQLGDLVHFRRYLTPEPVYIFNELRHHIE